MYLIIVIILEASVPVTQVYRDFFKCINNFSWCARAILFCKLWGNWKTSSCLNNTAYLLYFPKDWHPIHDVQWRRDKQVKKEYLQRDCKSQWRKYQSYYQVSGKDILNCSVVHRSSKKLVLIMSRYRSFSLYQTIKPLYSLWWPEKHMQYVFQDINKPCFHIDSHVLWNYRSGLQESNAKGLSASANDHEILFGFK